MTPAVAGNIYVPVTAQSPVSPTAAAVMSASPAIGSLPIDSVPSTIAVVEVRNNFRGAPVPVGYSKAQSEDETDETHEEIKSFLSGVTKSDGRSSSFMAQLLAQDPDSIILRGNAELETSNPHTMAVFSNIKYLPSNASKPSLFGVQNEIDESALGRGQSGQASFEDIFVESSPVSTLSYLRASESYSLTQSLAAQSNLIQ